MLGDNSRIAATLPPDSHDANSVDSVFLTLFTTGKYSVVRTVYLRHVSAIAHRFASDGLAPKELLATDIQSSISGRKGFVRCHNGAVGCRRFRTVQHLQRTIILGRVRLHVRASSTGAVHLVTPLHMLIKGSRAIEATLTIVIKTPHRIFAANEHVLFVPHGRNWHGRNWH